MHISCLIRLSILKLMGNMYVYLYQSVLLPRHPADIHMGTRPGEGQSGRTLPQSMRHQRILDLAAKQPNASMESIAEDVPSATVELVEHVLEEYGDPADDETTESISASEPDRESHTVSIDAEDSGGKSDSGNTESHKLAGDDVKHESNQEYDSDSKADMVDEDGTESESPHSSHENPDAETTKSELTHPAAQARDDTSTLDHDLPSVPDLTEGQREVLRVVAERPDATQQEIADRLDISAPTVSNRVNAIEGFDWQHREQAVETFRNRASDQKDTHASMSTNETNLTDETDRLEERIDTLETKIMSDQTTTDKPLDLDPELLQKVVHACFKSETISEDEELELLKLFLPEDT